MSSGIARSLFQFAITTIASGIYTVPTGVKTVLKSFDVANTTVSGISFRMYLVPRGQNISPAYALAYNKVVNAEDVLGWEGEQVLNFGDSVQVSALSAGLGLSGSGVEIS